jgi:uncharacterized protein YndB with AHSA1/START domain
MVDILHRIGVKGSAPGDVYAALAARDGLASWWTTQTEGESTAGEVLRFGFESGGVEIGSIGMKVLELVPDKLVLWEVVDGPPEWIGTTVGFELKQEDDFTIVLFKPEGWSEPLEFMYHCSTKWATFLLSLKSLVETGSGQPAPNDAKVSNWH